MYTLFFLSLAIVFISSFLLKQYAKPTRRAFRCADLNLYYPPPTDNLFPKQRLYICTILMPTSVVCREDYLDDSEEDLL